MIMMVFYENYLGSGKDVDTESYFSNKTDCREYKLEFNED